jgi:hypothetical protein
MPQLPTTLPAAVAPVRVMAPLPPVPLTVMVLPLAEMEVMPKVVQKIAVHLAVKPPEAVAPVSVVTPVWPPLSLQVIVFPEAVTEVSQALVQSGVLLLQLAVSPPIAVTVAGL